MISSRHCLLDHTVNPYLASSKLSNRKAHLCNLKSPHLHTLKRTICNHTIPLLKEPHATQWSNTSRAIKHFLFYSSTHWKLFIFHFCILLFIFYFKISMYVYVCAPMFVCHAVCWCSWATEEDATSHGARTIGKHCELPNRAVVILTVVIWRGNKHY